MAATYADLSRLDKILKDRPILDAIQEAMNKATPFAEKITNQLTLSGRKGIFPVQFGVNEGIYARADRGTFGDSEVDAPVLAEVTAKYVYATFDISGPTMSATRDSAGAFQDALALNLENTVTGVKLDMARMVLNGAFGIIGRVVSRTSSTVAVVKDPYGLSDYKGTWAVKNILRPNMSVDILTTSTGAQQSTGAISSIAHTAGSAGYSTMTLDTAETGTIAATNEVFRHGNRALEPVGFFGAIALYAASNTYLNVSRSGQPAWEGVITDAAGGGATAVALDPDMLRDEMDTIMETSGRTPNLIVANYQQRRNIYNLYAPQIRYAPMVLPAGLRESTLAFDDVPVLAERFFPPEHIGFVSTDTWYHAIDKDVEWIQGLGGTVLHFTLTADVYRAVLRTYRNFACLFPAANGYVYGVAQ